MSWYRGFNLTEAVIWWGVSLVIYLKVPRNTPQQHWGAIHGSIAFLAFGITDVIEAFHEHWIPLWLWAFKILCGLGILCSRYKWLGWSRFRWTDREFLFGLACLIAAIMLILLQHKIIPIGTLLHGVERL